MRQVPKQYCVVGNGKMAKHFCHYLQHLKQPFSHWHRSLDTPLKLAIATCQRILLLISDDAIEPFIQANPCLHKKTLIHFSGLLETPLATGVHPLYTFSTHLYTQDTYLTIPFIIPEHISSLTTLLPGLPNPYFHLNRNFKAKYHCLCVMGGNFTTLLWQRCLSEFQQSLGLPKAAILPYLTQIFKNLLHHPEQALTGPLVRNDQKTIQHHLQALASDPFKEIYQAFVKTYQEHLSGVQGVTHEYPGL